MNVKIIFNTFSFSNKIKRLTKDDFEIHLPALIKAKIPFEKIKEGQELEIDLPSLLHGLGDLAAKFGIGGKK